MSISPGSSRRRRGRMRWRSSAGTGACRRCQTARLKLLRYRIQQVLVEAKQSQLEHAQLVSLVESELAAIQREEV